MEAGSRDTAFLPHLAGGGGHPGSFWPPPFWKMDTPWASGGSGLVTRDRPPAPLLPSLPPTLLPLSSLLLCFPRAPCSTPPSPVGISLAAIQWGRDLRSPLGDGSCTPRGWSASEPEGLFFTLNPPGPRLLPTVLPSPCLRPPLQKCCCKGGGLQEITFRLAVHLGTRGPKTALDCSGPPSGEGRMALPGLLGGLWELSPG